MWNDPKLLELVLQADKWHQAGDLSKALQLMDEAIGLAESAGAIDCVVQWRMHRALLATGNSGDYSELLAATKAASDFYTQQNNPLGRLESLINLAGLMTRIPDKSGAMRYLVEAETLLSSLSPSDLDELSPLRKASAISSETFLQLRAADLAQLRKYITNEMP